MSLKTSEIQPGMKPFDHLACPVCRGTAFTELLPAGGVWCDTCNANFSCRDTSGDPGLVVDCHIEHVHGQYLDGLKAKIRKHGTSPDFNNWSEDLLHAMDTKLPVYFYQVCKEPQEDGNWTDKRRWIFTSLNRQLKLWVYV